MTPEQVQERLQKIRDEIAHGEEDLLWHDVLMAVAEGVAYPRELASLALLTSDIDFARWRA